MHQKEENDSKNKTNNFRRMTTQAAAAAVTHATTATGDNNKGVGRQSTNKRDPAYLYSSLIAGMGSGAVSSFICAPLDLIRTRIQVWNEVVGSNKRSTAIPTMIRDIIRQDGIAGCFRGLGVTLLTVPAFWGVYCKSGIGREDIYKSLFILRLFAI
jgi:hypothetical protein